MLKRNQTATFQVNHIFIIVTMTTNVRYVTPDAADALITIDDFALSGLLVDAVGPV